MTLFAAAGGSIAVGPTSGGKVYAFNNLSTTPEVVAQVNPQRNTITFHNPGPVGFWVAPVVVQNAANNAPTQQQLTDNPLSPTTSALGGCWYVYPNGGQVTFSGETQKAWQAFSATGSGNPCTVSESNT